MTTSVLRYKADGQFLNRQGGWQYEREKAHKMGMVFREPRRRVFRPRSNHDGMPGSLGVPAAIRLRMKGETSNVV